MLRTPAGLGFWPTTKWMWGIAALFMTACNPFTLQFDDYSRDSLAAPQIGSLQAGKIGHHIEAASGNLQAGYTHAPLAQPIIPRVVDAFGYGVAGIRLSISVKSGGGTIDKSAATTDANGQAVIFWTTGPVPGANALTIFSLDPLVGLPVSVEFDAETTVDQPFIPVAIAIRGNSNNQSGPHNSILATPLQVLITNSLNVGIPGLQIDWAVTSGNATLSSSSTTTSASGIGSNALTLHATGPQTITATIHDYPSFSVSFNAASTSTSFNQIWNFLSTANASFLLGSHVDLSPANSCELIASSQTDQSSADFSSRTFGGSVYGTLSDGTLTGLKLGSAGGCDGTSTNCSEMDSTWTPKWTSLQAYYRFNNSYASEKGSFTGVPQGTPVFSSINKKLGAAALELDGSTQSVSSPLVSSAINNVSMSAWFRSNSPTQSGQIIFYNGSEASAGGYGFSLNNESTTSAHLLILYGGVSWTDTNVVISDALWHQGVLTISAGGIRSFYLDGRLIYSDVPTPPIAPTGITSIGATDYSNAANTRHFYGDIDEVGFWTTTLNAAEVRQLYDRQSPAKAGTFTSRVMDAYTTTQSWKTLGWTATFPVGKPMPDSIGTTAQNESTSDYSAFTSTSLMNGIVALYHLDEPQGTNGAGSVKDTSGSGAHGTPNGGTYGGPGVIGNAPRFSGSDFIDLGTPAQFPVGTSPRSMCAWAKPEMIGGGPHWIFAYGYPGGAQAMFLGMNGTTFLAGAFGSDIGAGGMWQLGVWSHACLTYDSTTAIAYFNGVAVATANVVWNLVMNNSKIGKQVNGGENWIGGIDEVALWNRSLAASEIKDLYHRGLSRVKFQVRSCSTSDCSGVAETWQGTDATAGSYFSEASNKTSNLVNSSAPNLTFANLATATPIPNRYFQYRTILESEASTALLQPEIKAVTIGPIHYDTTSPSVIGKTGINYYSLSGFSQLPMAPACASGVTYNIGTGTDPAFATWYWWNMNKASDCVSPGTGAWCASNNTQAQSNPSAVINSNVAGFPLSKGTVYFKAFLNSSGETPCSFNSVELDGQL